MNYVILERESGGVSYEEVVNLLHESFNERLEQGLHYTASSMTVDRLKEKTKEGIILVAKDKETEELLGVGIMNLRLNANPKYAYMEYGAVKPVAKHMGIGSKLLNARKQIAIDNGCEYILSDTSVNANSAVMYHLKNGFKIIGLESYRSTNYYSYLFRMQLTPSKKWNNKIYVKSRFIKSYIKTKLFLKEDGTPTLIGRIFK